MDRKHEVFSALAAAAVVILSCASPAGAQLATASASTLGLGGNATATARGISAISMNPAGLGMPGSGFTLALVPIQVRTGLSPVTLRDIKDFGGTVIPVSAKEDWLSRAEAEGSETGSVGIDVSGLALSAGHLGFQLSTIAHGNVDLSPEILQLILYGNAGRTGQAVDISFGGSALDAFAATTGALSFGLPLPSLKGSMAIGATLKYTVGHAVVVGRAQGGGVQSDPLRVSVDFPVVTIDDTDPGMNAGSGVGVDLGFQMKRDRVSLGAAVLNVFNTFSWDESKLFYRPGQALFEQGTNRTDFDQQPYSAAPAAVRETVVNMTFDPTIAVGGGYDVNPDFTVSADLRNRFGDGLDVGPKLHAGVGAEYHGLSALYLRGGGAVVSGGFEISGGLSLILGPVNLSLAAGLRQADLGDESLGQFTLSFGGR